VVGVTAFPCSNVIGTRVPIICCRASAACIGARVRRASPIRLRRNRSQAMPGVGTDSFPNSASMAAQRTASPNSTLAEALKLFPR